MNNILTFIFDFDSTFVQAESFDELISLILVNHPESEKQSILTAFKQITEQCMEGQFGFSESLQARFKYLNNVKPHRDHIDAVIQILKQKISPSFLRNQSFFEENSDRIYIVSSGFIDIIWPLLKTFGIKREHVFANSLLYDYEGNIIGFDEKNVLTQNQGKAKQLKILNLTGDIIIIGDGYNDYEIKELGLASSFFCYTETIKRPNVMKNADAIIEDLEGLFLLCHLPVKSHNNPRKVLLLENIDPFVTQFLHQEGYQVETLSTALSESELIEKLKTNPELSILGVRSKTKITKNIIDNAPNLEAIGAFCIGTNHIDLSHCLSKGIAVFNAPYSNTRSVVELAIAEIIILMRRVFEKSTLLHQGKWQKTSTGSHEVRGKKLGIIGYGNIGSQLSVLAESLGMHVSYYDILEKLPLGNAKPCHSLEELLSNSEIISLHVDGNPNNKDLLGPKEFEAIQPGALLLNLSRGHVVHIPSLVAALASGQIQGAAIDVFPEEPNSNADVFTSPLQNKPNVILTPHVGGSTIEAQRNIGEFVATRLHEYAKLGASLSSVNFPELQLPSIMGCHRIIHIHENVPGILAKINSLFAEHKANIEGQYLKTNAHVGYVITDINQSYQDGILDQLKAIQHTIKVRILY